LDIEKSMPGAGSPQAQIIMIEREVNIEFKKKLAKFLTGIERDAYSIFSSSTMFWSSLNV